MNSNSSKRFCAAYRRRCRWGSSLPCPPAPAESRPLYRWSQLGGKLVSLTFCRFPCPIPSSFFVRLCLFVVVVFRLMLVSPFPLFLSLPCFPWWRIVLLCYFVSALHPSMRISIACRFLPCFANVDLSWFLSNLVLFLYIFGYRLISSCFFRVETMLSYRFRLLLQLV